MIIIITYFNYVLQTIAVFEVVIEILYRTYNKEISIGQDLSIKIVQVSLLYVDFYCY